MKKSKRMLALLLAFVMLLALVACGQPASEQAESATQAQGEPVQQNEPAASETEAPDPVPDAVEVSSEDTAEPETPEVSKVDYDLPLFDETAEFSIFYALRGGQGGVPFPSKTDATVKYWSRLEENLNVSLSWIEPSELTAQEKYNLMMASGDITDIICENMLGKETGIAYAGGYDKAISDDLYLNLEPYVAEYAPNYAYYLADSNNAKNAYTDEGNLPAFYMIYNETALKSQMGVVINEQQFLDTGLEEFPTTIDGWRELCKIMKDNGVPYIIDTMSTGSMLNGWIASAVGSGVTSKPVIDAATGELVFDAITDEAREYIELFREFYAAGYIEPDFMSQTVMENPKWFTGELATKGGSAKQIETYGELYGIQPLAVPLIHRDGYEDGEIAIGTVDALLTNTGAMVISTSCKDIEGACRFLDWFYSDEGAEISNYGWVEGETYDVVDGKKIINDFYNSRDENNNAIRGLYTTDLDFGLVYININTEVFTDRQMEAVKSWTPDPEYPAAIYYSLPTAAALTSEESEAVTTLVSDLSTYIETTVMRWYHLDEELNDETWDEYVKTCESMHLDEILETYTAAYERYQAR